MSIQQYNQVVDISGWEIYEEVYSEGAREKSSVYCPLDTAYPFLIPKYRYMFKQSSYRYPSQFWNEIIAYHIGEMLDINVPPAFVAIDSVKNKIGALIEWFYTEPTNYVHGGDYLQRIIPQFDRVKGTQHNLKSVFRFGNFLKEKGYLRPTENWVTIWTEYLTFDVLIGNTDRHQENWGVLWERDKNNENKPSATLSPAFDNGTSLGSEILEENLQQYLNREKLERYINKGRHHMKWSANDPDKEGHFSMLEKLIRQHEGAKEIIQLMIAKCDLIKIKEILEYLSGFKVAIFLSKERCRFIHDLIALRKEKLQNVVRLA